MIIITNAEFANFLTNAPLYYKLKAVQHFKNSDDTYSNPLDFVDKVFKFKCPKEKEDSNFQNRNFR